MIEREITRCLIDLFSQYPFVTVTGPRQSGKTVLCRETFPHLSYANLEDPGQREFAVSDPRGFLAHLQGGAIIDEIQRVPDLLSYLQVFADEQRQNGLFVLTGSENFQLSEAISQSLAGRTGLLCLLPFTLEERARAGGFRGLDEVLYSGFYPRIHDQAIEPRRALSDYFATYVERDVRRLGGVRDLATFERFVRLCAGRVGRLTDLAALGRDAGVSHTTARNWLGVLEASYIAFRLPPFHANIRKRLVKSPKLYFYDVGLAAHLIGIEGVDQIATHPLRGSLFENLVVVEALKYRLNRGRSNILSFYRDSRGLECDLLFDGAHGRFAIECKAGATIASDTFASLNALEKVLPDIAVKAVVYGGTVRQSRTNAEVIPFDEFSDALERLEVARDVAAFVRARIPPSPKQTDFELLDLAYTKHVQPMVRGLQNAAGELTALFREQSNSTYISLRNHRVASTGFLLPENWERTKREHIVSPGFSFSDEYPMRISYRINLRSCSQPPELNLAIACDWTFSARALTRTLTLDGNTIDEIGPERFDYANLETRSARVDRVCSALLKRIRSEIENRG